MNKEENDKLEITKEELENLIQKKVKEEIKGKEEDKDQKDKEISRRGFLKKIGLGAAGLGALSLTPAAANLDFNHDGKILFNSDDLKVNSGNLDLQGNNIQNVREMGQKPVTSSEKYEVQFDGQDDQNVINFKSSGEITVDGTQVANIGSGGGGSGLVESFSVPGAHTVDSISGTPVSDLEAIEIEALGAGGGDGGNGESNWNQQSGGEITTGDTGRTGGYVQAVIDVTNKDKITVYVGGKGKKGESGKFGYEDGNSSPSGGSAGTKGLNSGDPGNDGKSGGDATQCSSYLSGAGGGGGASSGVKIDNTIVEGSGGSGGQGASAQGGTYTYSSWREEWYCKSVSHSGGSGGDGGGTSQAAGSRVLEKKAISKSGGNSGSGSIKIKGIKNRDKIPTSQKVDVKSNAGEGYKSDTKTIAVSDKDIYIDEIRLDTNSRSNKESVLDDGSENGMGTAGIRIKYADGDQEEIRNYCGDIGESQFWSQGIGETENCGVQKFSHLDIKDKEIKEIELLVESHAHDAEIYHDASTSEGEASVHITYSAS